MGLLLFITAVILLYILSIPMLILSFILTDSSNSYFRDLALAIDQLGNVLCGPVFNLIFLKATANVVYGNPDQTISYVTGKNLLENKLTIVGIGFAKFLNLFEKNHVQKAVELEEVKK